jgi:hypothetical protein
MCCTLARRRPGPPGSIGRAPLGSLASKWFSQRSLHMRLRGTCLAMVAPVTLPWSAPNKMPHPPKISEQCSDCNVVSSKHGDPRAIPQSKHHPQGCPAGVLTYGETGVIPASLICLPCSYDGRMGPFPWGIRQSRPGGLGMRRQSYPSSLVGTPN